MCVCLWVCVWEREREREGIGREVNSWLKSLVNIYSFGDTKSLYCPPLNILWHMLPWSWNPPLPNNFFKANLFTGLLHRLDSFTEHYWLWHIKKRKLSKQVRALAVEKDLLFFDTKFLWEDNLKHSCCEWTCYYQVTLRIQSKTILFQLSDTFKMRGHAVKKRHSFCKKGDWAFRHWTSHT